MWVTASKVRKLIWAYTYVLRYAVILGVRCQHRIKVAIVLGELKHVAYGY